MTHTSVLLGLVQDHRIVRSEHDKLPSTTLPGKIDGSSVKRVIDKGARKAGEPLYIARACESDLARTDYLKRCIVQKRRTTPSVFGQVPSETCTSSSPSRELLGLIRGKLKQASSSGNVVGLACTNTFVSLLILIPGGLGVVLLHLPAQALPRSSVCVKNTPGLMSSLHSRLLLGVEPGMKGFALTVNSSENKHRRYEEPELESV
ncbi:hypothetical protein ARMSODRAFT_982172 [Armillaria solidipes]|uniref:Uncharacterized protein n=1 Tax=Armillaria solidipes TaxID=1076256 RepID=A0A2H3B7S1_9AGAR|nr:hypothetical protein ARMSODRAFT_982172 [Armillaria solidipes]